MIRTLTMLLMLCGCITSANAQKKVSLNDAIVTIEQGSIKADSMFVWDQSKTEVSKIKPNAQGNFVLDLKAVSQKVVTIWTDKPKPWRIELHLEDGDRINVATDFTGNTKFSGKGAAKQEVIFLDTRKRMELYEKTDFKKISPDELLQHFNKIADESMAFLAENKQKVSPVFYKTQQINFLFTKQRTALEIPNILKSRGGRKFSTVIPEGYWTFDKGIKMDETLLLTKTYTDFISYSYVGFLRQKALIDQGMLDSTLSIEQKTKMDYELMEKNLKGKIRSLAMSKNFVAAFRYAKDVQVFKPLLDNYIAQYATTEDAKQTLTDFNKYAKINVGKVPPFFTLKGLDGRDVTLKDFAGKVVYMDFWASWCSPCRYEMKNGSPKLHTKFKDNKDVVFLYVSIDDKADLWKKAIADDKIEGIHLLSAGGIKSPVGQAFNIYGIPHYIIIGKDGKIFDNDAPRPSEDITQDKINEALKANN